MNIGRIGAEQHVRAQAVDADDQRMIDLRHRPRGLCGGGEGETEDDKKSGDFVHDASQKRVNRSTGDEEGIQKPRRLLHLSRLDTPGGSFDTGRTVLRRGACFEANFGHFCGIGARAGCGSEPSKPVPADAAPTAPPITNAGRPDDRAGKLSQYSRHRRHFYFAGDRDRGRPADHAGRPGSRPHQNGTGSTRCSRSFSSKPPGKSRKKSQVTVTQADIDAEYNLSVAALVPEATPDEFAGIVQQVLSSQHLTCADFDLWLQTNAYLRKAAEPDAEKWITDDRLHEAFNAMYGEQVQVRHIQFSHLSKAAEIKQRLAGGESFAQVAEDLSENDRTRRLGGELMPFSRNDPNLPAAFKDAAFSLKEGQISDIVEAEGAYHIILLEKRIVPKVVKFEDEKETLHKDLLVEGERRPGCRICACRRSRR